MPEKILKFFNRLKTYCESEGFIGYDPYDGLNSRFFNSLPLIRNNRIARLAWIQTFKRSPANLRPLMGISKEYNPKALGLFLSGYCLLYKTDPKQAYVDRIKFFSDKIRELSSPGYSGSCWGYNFDWESRAFFLPKFTPTIVVSSFVAGALLDSYEIIPDKSIFDAARSTCDFILKDLNRTYDKEGDFAFSYSRLDNTVVYNASLLGSALLARVYDTTGEDFLIDQAVKVIRFCCKAQKEDGSWTYGTLPFHQWIDNFHTGYNLQSVSDYSKYSGDQSFLQHLERGFKFYINTFFTAEGIPKYYNDSVYPVDIHSPAQLIITLLRLGKLSEYSDLADKVLNWTIDNMQSEKGYFYYQKNRYFMSKIPYMRWAQAWMFLALSGYFLYQN